MTGTIFINYRREDSISTAGRLHDRLAQAFGRKNIFMDVDHIPAGVDFVAHLNSQVAACKIVLVVIGPHWLDAKDESGGRRLDNPDDFVTIEIATALARNIRVVPILVDGAGMPKARELPDSLKLLARRQAVEVRQLHFGRDAEALVERVREALNGDSVTLRLWRGKAVAGAAAVAVLLLVGGIGLSWTSISVWTPWAGTREGGNAKAQAEAQAKRKADEAEQYRLASLKAEQERQAKAQADAEAKRKMDEAEQQRLASLKAEQERQARAAVEAETKRMAEQAEQQRLAALKAEQDRTRAEAEVRARYSALVTQGDTAINAGNYDRAIATLSEAIRLNANDDTLASFKRGVAYANKGDYDRAIADFNEAVRLDPKYALAFRNRGLAYERKGDHSRAIADFNEAIRLDPKYALAFYSRGITYETKGDNDQAIADFSAAIQLNPTYALAFGNRGLAYERKGSHDRAITDYNEAIRLDPKYAIAFESRGVAYGNKGDYDRAIADFNEAIRLDPKYAIAFSNRGLAYERKGNYDRAIADYNEAIGLNPNDATVFCRRGRAKLKIDEQSGHADIAKARQLDASVFCR
jgi:tetratricopeptide (TPR) repeat protein